MDTNNNSVEEQYSIITRDLAEVIGGEEVKEILKTRKLKIYWGTATTGKPHLGYFVPIFKIADFLEAGCEVKILLADLHGYLDNKKSDWALLKKRTEWYNYIIHAMLERVGVNTDKLTFVTGSSFQLSKEYSLDYLRLFGEVTIDRGLKSGSEVVKKSDSPLVSSLVYPILQALDEQHLDVDVQFGGIDQRKIFMLAREILPSIGYKKRSHFMNPLIPGLGESGKMSSSEPNSKIDFDDSEQEIRKKIKKAFCKDKSLDNGLLPILKYILFKYLNRQQKPFFINRPEKFGGPITYNTYQEAEAAFAEGTLCAPDLKIGVTDLLMEFLEPLKKKVEERKDLLGEAYPKTK